MLDRRCVSCGGRFHPRPQAPDQQDCSEKACQRARRRDWQREKQRRDADYRDNQRRAWRAWAARHADYWREWRAGHPEYCERNRERQEVRDRRRRLAGLLAKMDAWTVRIAVISGPSDAGGRPDGCLQKEYSIGSGAAGD
jgi:hypothetical protein